MCVLNAQTITITGTVNDKIGNPVEEVSVSYLCDGTDIITPVQTDSTGYFEFTFEQLGIDDNTLPNSINLGANYPNPFNPGTVIPLSTNKPGLFLIHDLLGRQIQSIAIKVVGDFKITWGGKLNSGLPAPAGIYFYSFQTDENRLTGKMILMDGGGNTGLSISGSTGVTQQRQTRRNTECENHTITFTADHITDFEIDLGEIGYTEDTNITQEVNRGPYWLFDLPNPYLPEGDTLILNLNEYVYDDGQSLYQISNTQYFQIVQDTILWCVVLDSIIVSDILANDDEDTELSIGSFIQVQMDNTHIFFITDGDPKGIYVLNPYTMTYVDSFMTQDTISYRDIIPNEVGDTWYAIRNIHHPGQNIVDTHIDWIDVETKEVFQTIEGSNKNMSLELSYDRNIIIAYDWNPTYTFSVYNSDTGDFLGGRDTTLHVKLVRASKTENIIFIWGWLRDGGGMRLGAWDLEIDSLLWLLPYDTSDNMYIYNDNADMTVSYDGEHVFLRGADNWGNSKFWDINAHNGAIISENYVYGYNQLMPTKNNQYLYLTHNQNYLDFFTLAGNGGIARYDIQNNIMEQTIESLNDLGYECGEISYFGSIVMSVLPDNETGIIFTASFCQDDSLWDPNNYILKLDLENMEFLEGIYMPTTTMPGYQTQLVKGPFIMGNYPF
jgi:hypothetical protein